MPDLTLSEEIIQEGKGTPPPVARPESGAALSEILIREGKNRGTAPGRAREEQTDGEGGGFIRSILTLAGLSNDEVSRIGFEAASSAATAAFPAARFFLSRIPEKEKEEIGDKLLSAQNVLYSKIFKALDLGRSLTSSVLFGTPEAAIERFPRALERANRGPLSKTQLASALILGLITDVATDPLTYASIGLPARVVKEAPSILRAAKVAVEGSKIIEIAERAEGIIRGAQALLLESEGLEAALDTTKAKRVISAALGNAAAETQGEKDVAGILRVAIERQKQAPGHENFAKALDVLKDHDAFFMGRSTMERIRDHGILRFFGKPIAPKATVRILEKMFPNFAGKLSVKNIAELERLTKEKAFADAIQSIRKIREAGKQAIEFFDENGAHVLEKAQKSTDGVLKELENATREAVGKTLKTKFFNPNTAPVELFETAKQVIRESGERISDIIKDVPEDSGLFNPRAAKVTAETLRKHADDLTKVEMSIEEAGRGLKGIASRETKRALKRAKTAISKARLASERIARSLEEHSEAISRMAANLAQVKKPLEQAARTVRPAVLIRELSSAAKRIERIEAAAAERTNQAGIAIISSLRSVKSGLFGDNKIGEISRSIANTAKNAELSPADLEELTSLKEAVSQSIRRKAEEIAAPFREGTAIKKQSRRAILSLDRINVRENVKPPSERTKKNTEEALLLANRIVKKVQRATRAEKIEEARKDIISLSRIIKRKNGINAPRVLEKDIERIRTALSKKIAKVSENALPETADIIAFTKSKKAADAILKQVNRITQKTLGEISRETARLTKEQEKTQDALKMVGTVRFTVGDLVRAARSTLGGLPSDREAEILKEEIGNIAEIFALTERMKVAGRSVIRSRAPAILETGKEGLGIPRTKEAAALGSRISQIIGNAERHIRTLSIQEINRIVDGSFKVGEKLEELVRESPESIGRFFAEYTFLKSLTAAAEGRTLLDATGGAIITIGEKLGIPKKLFIEDPLTFIPRDIRRVEKQIATSRFVSRMINTFSLAKSRGTVGVTKEIARLEEKFGGMKMAAVLVPKKITENSLPRIIKQGEELLGGTAVIMPERIANLVTNNTRILLDLLGESTRGTKFGSVLNVFNRMTDYFRMWAIRGGITPRLVTQGRNLISDQILLFLGGMVPFEPHSSRKALKTLLVARALKQGTKLPSFADDIAIIDKFGREYTYGEMAVFLSDLGHFGNGTVRGDFTVTGLAGHLEVRRRDWRGVVSTIWNYLPETFSDYANGYGRAMALFQRMNLGDDLFEASIRVKGTLYDYTALSPLERTIVRPIVPFYSWMRFNLPAMLAKAAERPIVFTAPLRASKGSLNAQGIEPEQLPGWALTMFPIMLPLPKGDLLLLSQRNVLPNADLLEAFNALTNSQAAVDFVNGQLNPFLQFFSTALLNRDIFGGSEASSAYDFEEPVRVGIPLLVDATPSLSLRVMVPKRPTISKPLGTALSLAKKAAFPFVRRETRTQEAAGVRAPKAISPVGFVVLKKEKVREKRILLLQERGRAIRALKDLARRERLFESDLGALDRIDKTIRGTGGHTKNTLYLMNLVKKRVRRR